MTLGFQDKNFDLHYENVVIKNSAEELPHITFTIDQ